MKLLLENWRLYSGEYDFNILCENHKHGLISEAQLLETWEKQALTEIEYILTENLMDILKQGYAKGKQLAGKAKELYNKALEKVNDLMLKLYTQAWTILQKIKNPAQGISKLSAIFNKIKSWCSAHPILCFAAKVMIVFIAIAAISSFLGSDTAHAAIEHKGRLLSQNEYDVIQGSMSDYISALNMPAEVAPGIPGTVDFEAMQAVKEVQIILKQAYESTDVQTLEQVAQKADIPLKAITSVLEKIQQGLKGDQNAMAAVQNWLAWGRGLQW
jgi:hypothetical protein